MSNPYDDDLSQFAVTFLRFTMAWNGAEQSARRILEKFGGQGIGLMVVVEQLHGRSLKEALLTLCDMFSDPATPVMHESSDHISHFVAGWDTLRVYRNFYIHSIRYTGKAPDNEGVFQGRLMATEAKGKFAWINQAITTDELETFMRHALELQDYGEGIADSLPGRGLGGTIGSLFSRKPLSSLQKPIWPEALKKDRSYLRERAAQP